MSHPAGIITYSVPAVQPAGQLAWQQCLRNERVHVVALLRAARARGRNTLDVATMPVVVQIDVKYLSAFVGQGLFLGWKYWERR
jgi:hypothetical protein